MEEICRAGKTKSIRVARQINDIKVGDIAADAAYLESDRVAIKRVQRTSEILAFPDDVVKGHGAGIGLPLPDVRRLAEFDVLAVYQTKLLQGRSGNQHRGVFGEQVWFLE